MPTELRLPFDAEPEVDRVVARDESARAYAVDPSRNVVLEASAGTGKTHVLVTRYINLIRAGVDPANILAITFTRKAAAEMRERIVLGLRERARLSREDEERWRALRDRLGDIAISTIDAFCFSLLREFPLEADLDPGFDVADETVMPRLVDDAIDGALRAGRRLSATDPDIALLLAALGERQLRSGLAALLDRRLSAGGTIRRFLGAAGGASPADALARLSGRMRESLQSIEGGIESFIADGPSGAEGYALLAADLRIVASGLDLAPLAATGERAAVVFPAYAILRRVFRHFTDSKGAARAKAGFPKKVCHSPAAWARHSEAVAKTAPGVVDAFETFEREINVALVRATGRLFRIARGRYRRALDTKSSVDFPEALSRALLLLRQMDEFAQSRYRLEARYHHVLVDEFQDTNASQWRLVARLIESWGEGLGVAHDGPLQPSIFIVGDRKQSIYAFRDADVRIIRRAGRYISALRPSGKVRRSISRSFRSAPQLLAFTNDLFASIDTSIRRADAFRYTTRDRFPVDTPDLHDVRLGLVGAATTSESAAAIAGEIQRLLAEGCVQDRQTKLSRAVRPGDIAILFRSRESHREIEAALEARRIPTYVYKGLGFFDADEVKDLVALLRYLANPASKLRAAAFVRSRFVRLSDPALRLLSPTLVAVMSGREPVPEGLADADRAVLERIRASLSGWLPLVDRLPPAEVLDRVIDESAYAFEAGGARAAQARENIKKVRAMARRLQNRGYATMARVASHLDRLSTGDESNAVVDALDAVNLMTVHAAKGLEFPVVFLTNLTRGTGGGGAPVVLVPGDRKRPPLVSVGGNLREATEAAKAGEREETKRLLYVAVTRARERLYLASVVKDGKFRPGQGSLAEVLPPSMTEAFLQAATGAASVDWRAENGGSHRFHVVSPPASESADLSGGDAAPGADAAPKAPSDFTPLLDVAGERREAAAARARAAVAPGISSRTPSDNLERASEGSQILGTVVHRLFEVAHRRMGVDHDWLMGQALSLVSGEADSIGVEDHGALAAEAVHTYLSLRQSADLASLLETATCHFEVPVSVRVPRTEHDVAAGAMVVRGSIDCLAIQTDGRIRVVEIKTGRRQAWHEEQLETYVSAVRLLYPGTQVDGQLVYPSSDATGIRDGASNQMGEPKPRA